MTSQLAKAVLWSDFYTSHWSFQMMVKAANQLVKSSITFTEFFWSLSVVILYQSILNLYLDCFSYFYTVFPHISPSVFPASRFSVFICLDILWFSCHSYRWLRNNKLKKLTPELFTDLISVDDLWVNALKIKSKSPLILHFYLLKSRNLSS